MRWWYIRSSYDHTRRGAVLFLIGLLLLSSSLPIISFEDAKVASSSSRQDDGVWTSTKIWSDSKHIYDAEVGDVWPGHPGNEIIVGGESNWTTMIYGHENSWQSVRLFQEAWYVTNIAIGDIDPAEPGNEIVNVGWHGNVSMVYWEDATSKWRHVELVNGNEAHIDWGYGLAIGDFDPRYEGNEVAMTDDNGYLLLVRRSGVSWTHEIIFKEEGPDVVKKYLDTVLLGDFDPDHSGDEILVAGGSRYVTQIQYNGSDQWISKRLWKEKKGPIQLVIGDIQKMYPGNEIGVVGLDHNVTVRHWNGTDWVQEWVYTDDDVLYDVEFGEVVSGEGPVLITGGWSSKVIYHRPLDQGRRWESNVLDSHEDIVSGVTIGDFDDLHPGNEIVSVDRLGQIKKTQYETWDFVLKATSEEESVSAGSSASFHLLLYSRAGFDENVVMKVTGLPMGWSPTFSPPDIVPTGYVLLTIVIPSDANPGRTYLTVVAEGTTKEHSVDISVWVLPPGEKDFNIRGIPSAQSVVADYSVTYTVVLDVMNGFSDKVQLLVLGLPDGAIGTFSNDLVSPPGSGTLEVRTVASTPKGTFYVQVSGEGGGKSHVTTLVLKVTESNSPDFIINLAPSTVEAVGSRSLEVTVNVISLFGFSAPVNISASKVPPGMNVTFESSSVEPTAKALMNVTVEATLPKGSYYIEVSGRSTSAVHGATLRLNLNTMGDPSFLLKAFPSEANVTASGSVFYNITATPLNDFGARISLSVEGLPPDTVASFNQLSISPYGFATLEIKTLVSTPEGQYDMKVIGTGSGLVQKADISLNILAARPLLNMIKLEVPYGSMAGQKVKSNVWVENLGPVNATDITIELMVDGRIVDDGKTSLTPGSGDQVELAWKATSGKHNVTAKIVESADLDVLTGSLTKDVSVSGPLSVEGGAWTLYLLMIIVIMVTIVLIGYAMGKKVEGHKDRHEQDQEQEHPDQGQRGRKDKKRGSSRGPSKKED